jgi:hypothetical protein
MQDFGAELAGMTTQIGTTDLGNWSVRSNGESGFLFVNNFMRLNPQPARKSVKFSLRTQGGVVDFPANSVDIPADSYFAWPFNMDLGGVNLTYATAQPVCTVGDAYFFAETKGVPAEFGFFEKASGGIVTRGSINGRPGRQWIADLRPGIDPVITIQKNGRKPVKVYLLDEALSKHVWKGILGGKVRVVVSDDDLVFNNGGMVLTSQTSGAKRLAIYPSLDTLKINSKIVKAKSQSTGISLFQISSQAPAQISVASKLSTGPGTPREIKNGSQGVAEQPSDSDFASAGTWEILLPKSLPTANWILNIKYEGDAARLYLDGKLINDNFYNGKPFELGLARFGSKILTGKLELKILPLRKDAPIYFAPGMKPEFGTSPSVCKVVSLNLVGSTTVVVKPK